MRQELCVIIGMLLVLIGCQRQKAVNPSAESGSSMSETVESAMDETKTE